MTSLDSPGLARVQGARARPQRSRPVPLVIVGDPTRRAVLAALLLGTLASPAVGEVFKFQDADGRWHFTDRPPPGTGAPPPAAPADRPAATRDLAAALVARFGAGTPIQQATLATVAVKTESGEGAGFFVTADGFILTNRHVVRPARDPGDKDQALMDDAQRRLTAMQAELAARRARMDAAAAQLAALEQQGQGRSPNARGLQREVDYYRSWTQGLASQVTEGQRALRKGKLENDLRLDGTLVQTNFTIVLKDGEHLTARLVGTSDTQDLALLKLDGYRTPALRIAGGGPGQGDAVYAIGNPLGVSDSVTAGRVTRLSDDRIMTDVQLLPGNSGGPLVNKAGEVVAVNFAKLTHGGDANYQGFGVAIPIAIARGAFAELR